MHNVFPRNGVNDYLTADHDYNLLSLRDLVEARDHYHAHLMHKENVVATALGLFRFRHSDPWPNDPPRQVRKSKTKKVKAPTKPPRTLASSEVRPYSWPCVLVFVDRWLQPDAFDGETYQAQDMVPTTLYLPDGRIVPVCVIEAPRYLQAVPGNAPLFPKNNIGGGYPIISRVQGEERFGTVGCLVSDGHETYALTSRHVTGRPGEVLYSRLDDVDMPVGVSSDKQLTRLPFQEVFREWPGKDVFVNLDVGLVRVDDLSLWTAKVRNVGQVGPMADLSVYNLSLKLIGAPVRAVGATSGDIQGEIHGLFYRYKSVGGFEHVSDFLIGERTLDWTERRGKKPRATPAPPPPPFATHPGDSGAIWLLEKSEHHGEQVVPPMPLAIQWGGHVFEDASGRRRHSFALATALSTVCNRLEVDLIRDWNLDQVDYWGAVGHYSIASRAIRLVSSSSPNLKQLLTANLERISYDDATLKSSDFKGQTELSFVPLADVPDNLWKHGKQGYTRAHEGPNHFADMDQPSPKFQNKDLLTLCKDPAFIDPAKWNEFYESVVDLLDGKKIERKHRGLLPFRVRQLFEAMVDFASRGNGVSFLCAAGVLAHYVGDACQPLHISYLHDGDPEDFVVKEKTDRYTHVRKLTRVPVAMGVHSAYEDQMFDKHRKEILDGLVAAGKVKKAEYIADGPEAALRTVELMRDTFNKIKPKKIVAAYPKGKNGFDSRAEFFWNEFGTRTIEVMQNGTHFLAVLWESAWALGDGENNVTKLTKATTTEINRRVRDPDFVPSCFIDEIGDQF